MKIIVFSLLLLFSPGAHPWPLRRKSAAPSRVRRIIAEAVEAGRAAEIQPPPNLFEYFLQPFGTNMTRKDWGRAMSLALENFRVPAALVAGTALANAFALPPAASDEISTAILKRVYLLLTTSSFMSSMITVALATSALVQLNEKYSERDAMASSLEDFIGRAGFELGRETWFAVNAHFIIGVVALCCSVGVRCWVDFADRTFGRIASMMVASGALTIVSLGVPRGYIISLATRHTSAIVRKGFDWRSPSPGLMMALLLAVAAACLTARELAVLLVQASTTVGET